MNVLQKISIASLSLALAACSTSQVGGIDYKSARRGNSLETPPDLTRISGNDRYNVPSSTSAVVFASGQKKEGQASTTALNAMGDVKIKRDGNKRWLVVARTPAQLWEPVKSFWEENGFALTVEDLKVGVMETDWAENRAKLPQDVVRAALGKVFDSLYSTGERDKFRTRLERNANGGTDIFISHRGMIEVYTNTQKDQTVWQPRAADPELETEFLRRLMVKLGVSQEQSKAIAATAPTQQTPAARIATVNNAPVVQLAENFDRAWRRVGLALDRTGFTVEDRNRNDGLYFVRYVAPNADKKEPGFFGKLFGGSSAAVPPLKYRIAVRSEGNASTVSVLNEAGAPESSANAERIVRVIADELK